MMLLNGLRMAADLAFYYAFAGFFVAFSGTPDCLPGILIPSLCFAVSSGLRNKKILRLTVLLPEAITFFLPGIGAGDRIALIPVVGYTVFLAWTGNYSLAHGRQKETFLLFCKIYLPFFLLITLLGGVRNLISASLPMALIMLTCSVFLLQVLRHEPEVYRQPRFLLRSLLPLALLLGIAWLLHFPAVLSALGTAAAAVYQATVVPVVMGITYVLAFLIIHILSPLMALFPTEDSDTELETAFESLTDETAVSGSSGIALPFLILRTLGILLVIALVILVLVLLFRRLAGKRTNSESEGPASSERRTDRSPPPEAPGLRLPRSPRDPVNQVRRQYRRYLHLCATHGFTPHVSYTSGDIQRNTDTLFPDPAPAEELRSLYIRARYHGIAAKEDALRARDLGNNLKEQKRAG